MNEEGRGDVITLKSLQFEPLGIVGTSAEPSLWVSLGLDLMSLIQAAVLGLVALLLGLFVIRPILSGSRTAAPAALEAPRDSASPQPMPSQAALTGEIDTSEMDTDSLPVVSGRSAIAASLEAGEDPVARLRGMIADRQDETVEILRNWLEGEEENA